MNIANFKKTEQCPFPALHDLPLLRMMTLLREEVRRFCMSSTIKGMPRIIHSDSQCLRVFWIVGVLILVASACYQVHLLLLNFFNYPVVTFIHESSVHPKENMPPVPYVTVCSTSPVPSSVQYPAHINTPHQYLDLVNKKFNCSEGDEECVDLQDSIKTAHGYFEYIGLDNAQLISHNVSTFIANCRMILLQGMQRVHKQCDQHVHITHHFFTNYFSCAEVSATPNLDRMGFLLGVELTLYFDHHNQTDDPFTKGLYTHGATIVLHETGAKGAAPFLDIHGTFIPTGSDVTVNLYPKWRTRLPSPHGDCVDYSTNGSFLSQYHCFATCSAAFVLEECDCVDPVSPVDTYPLNTTTYCQSLHQPADKLLKSLVCRKNSLVSHIEDILDLCPPACEEIQYVTEVQTNAWPDPAYYTSFYQDIIKSKPYAHQFSDFSDYLGGNCSDKHSCELLYVSASRLIHSNFARLSYRLKDHRFYNLKDVKKIVTSELLSQLGGTLNLWSGITIIVLLELAEMLYRICKRLVKPGIDKYDGEANVNMNDMKNHILTQDQ